MPASGSDELGDLERSFNAMAAALQQAETHKRTLVSDVAHELRTPLTNILGSIEAMQDGLLTPDAGALASLGEEAMLLAGLVSELQELSLAESGQLVFDMEVVDANAAARAAVEAVRPTARELAVRGPEDNQPAPVRADARRLAQVLRNLLANAITHTPPGGEVHVQVQRLGSTVRISMRDTGSGIPAAHLPLVWERFHRVDRSRQRGSGGMGLALVRQLVLGMGGTIDADSVEGHGSTFRVELPAA